MKKLVFVASLAVAGVCISSEIDNFVGPIQPTPVWKKWATEIIKICNAYTDSKTFPIIDITNRVEKAESNIIALSNGVEVVDSKVGSVSNDVVVVDGKVLSLSNTVETVNTTATSAKTTAEAALPNNETEMTNSTEFVGAVGLVAPVKSVNGKTGAVTITSFEEFPASWKAAAQYSTISNFFEAVKATNPEAGRCFLGSFRSMDPAPTPALRYGNYEVVIKVPVRGVYVLEVTSTNVSPYHWYATCDTLGEGGAIAFGGWRQIMNAETPENIGMYALRCTRNKYGVVEMYWDSYTDTSLFKKETLNTTYSAQPSTWQFNTSTAVLRYSAMRISTINFSFSVLNATDAANGVYTWELIISSDQDITSCTMGTGVSYVGNDKTTNPDHAYARIDAARTYHVFAVRAFKTDAGFGNWQVAYNYSFKAE